MSGHPLSAQVAVNLRSVYAPTAAQRLAQLAEAADSAKNAVADLQRDLTAERAERLSIQFGGMQREAALLSEALRRDPKA